MEANRDISSNNIVIISDPVNSPDAVTKNYLTNYRNYTKLSRPGDSIFGDRNIVKNKITNLLNPTYNKDAAAKKYVNNVLHGLINLLLLMLEIHR